MSSALGEPSIFGAVGKAEWSPLCRCGRPVDPTNGPTVQVTETMRRTAGEHGYKVIEQQTYATVFCSLVCAAKGLTEYVEVRS